MRDFFRIPEPEAVGRFIFRFYQPLSTMCNPLFLGSSHLENKASRKEGSENNRLPYKEKTEAHQNICQIF
nr:hypothetical protein MarFTME_004 [Marseillevirus futianmevirus]